ncbi:MAG TPA: HEAT repeat domain-containing protein [Pirellulaceae bacterium]|jgi:hypothetical protein|nr:HEAT repeat domain-containing protein [Pirellulaceae bacterium]
MTASEVLRRCVAFPLVVAAFGCEQAPPALPPQAVSAPAAPPLAPVDPPRPKRPPLALTSVDQALGEMISAVEERRSRDYQAASEYLRIQGEETIAAVESRLAAGGLSAPAEIALVRQLASAGEAALPQLEKLADPSQKEIVRLNAIEQIGAVRPVTPRATEFLRARLREGQPRDRTEALKALEKQGASSAEFAEELRQIMESDAPETLRIQAKKSLDRVVPRRTFEDRK